MRVALIILTLTLFFFFGFYEAYSNDDCQDFKTDMFICLNEGPDAVYARYGREYKGKLPRTEMFTMCRLKKSEWYKDDKGKKDLTYKCTYEHPQGLPDQIMTTGPRYQCPRNIQCKVK